MFAERISFVVIPASFNAVRTAAADFDAVDSAAAFVEPTVETVALKRTASGTTETVPTPVTVMKRLVGASAPFAGIAKATTPATVVTVTAVRTVRSLFSFMYQVSTNYCELTKRTI